MTTNQVLDGNYKPVPTPLYDPASGNFAVKRAGTTATASDQTFYADDIVALSQNNTGFPVNVPVIVQSASGKSTGSVASLPVAFANPNNNNTNVKNSIVVVVGIGNGTDPTIADTNGNTYTKATTAANSTTFESSIWHAVGVKGGTNTVTITNAGTAASMAATIYEVSGLITQVTAQPDQTVTNTGTGTTASTSAVNPASPNELAFLGVTVGTAAQNLTAGTGWTFDSGQQNPTTPAGLYSFGSFSQFLGSLKATTPSVTIAGSEPWAAAVATFRPVILGIEGTVDLAIGGTALTAPADSLAFSNAMPSVNMQQTGTAVASPRRTITKFVQLQAQAITHATPVDVYTPTSGKKWRILAYHLSAVTGCAIQFEDTTGVEVLRTPVLASAGIVQSPDMGNGYLSTAANNHLFLDVTVTSNVSGWIGIMEE